MTVTTTAIEDGDGDGHSGECTGVFIIVVMLMTILLDSTVSAFSVCESDDGTGLRTVSKVKIISSESHRV